MAHHEVPSSCDVTQIHLAPEQVRAALHERPVGDLIVYCSAANRALAQALKKRSSFGLKGKMHVINIEDYPPDNHEHAAVEDGNVRLFMALADGEIPVGQELVKLMDGFPVHVNGNNQPPVPIAISTDPVGFATIAEAAKKLPPIAKLRKRYADTGFCT